MLNKQTHITTPGAPRPLCLGPLTKGLIPGFVQAAVQAKKTAWTIRALILLASSRMSRMSRQTQHIARARARVSLFYSDIYFQTYKNLMDIMDGAYRNNILAWTFRMDGLGHHGRKGFLWI